MIKERASIRGRRSQFFLTIGPYMYIEQDLLMSYYYFRVILSEERSDKFTISSVFIIEYLSELYY